MRFWDSSGLIPLLVREPSSDECQALLTSDPIVAFWWGTPTEISSSLIRKAREGLLTSAEVSQARKNLEALLRSGPEVTCSEEVRSTAYNLLRLHPLRSANSLQLAAYLELVGHRTAGLEFVCLDKRLREAALGEGATVLP